MAEANSLYLADTNVLIRLTKRDHLAMHPNQVKS